MSSTSKPRSTFHFLYFFLVAGVLLRIVGLYFFPSGFEGDEASVVYWGRYWVREGHWLLLTSEDLPAWETPVAYLFGALDLLGIHPRLGAVAMSLLELALCFLWTRRRAGADIALLATTFLALMPWHFFFSYVLGPCVAGVWTCLYLMDFKKPWARIATNIGGLFYYATFRIVLVWGGLKNIWHRRWRMLGLDLIAAALALVFLFLLGEEQFQLFFKKGAYLVLERGWVEWLHHYLNAVLLWWLPPLQVFWQGIAQYSMDDVGFGFAHTLGWQTPLSLGTSFFFAWGLYLCWRQQQHRDLLGFFVVAVLLVGFSPSYVHFPFILPVVAFIAAVAAKKSLEMSSRLRPLLVLSLTLSLCSLLFVIFSFGRSDRWETFTNNIDQIPQVVAEKTSQEPFLWSVGFDYLKARIVADRAGLEVIGTPPTPEEWFRLMYQRISQTQIRWVFVQTTSRTEHPRPEMVVYLKQFYEAYQDNLRYFENNMNVKSKTEIRINDKEMGVLYELGD